jgi:hypothetical protein
MLAISVIALSTVVGLLGGPIWAATACGLILALFAMSDRAPTLRRARAISRAAVITSIGASLVVAQVASIGTFAVGRLLGELLLA